MNWDCSEFLELILINLPGLPKDSGSTSWRLSHKNVAQGVTFNERYLKYSHGAFSSFLWGRCPAKDTMANLLCYSVSVLFLKLIFLFWQAGVFSSVVAKVIVLVPRLGKFMFFSCVKPRKSGESNAAPTVLDAMEY